LDKNDEVSKEIKSLLEKFMLPINQKTTIFIKEFINDQGGLDNFQAKTLKKRKKQAPIAPNVQAREEEIVELTNENLPKPLPRKQIQELPIPKPRYKLPPSAPLLEDEEDLCKICMINELECVFYDCGHMICCMNCSFGLTNCPVCQKTIFKPIKVFK
jgi:hypothetical protein